MPGSRAPRPSDAAASRAAAPHIVKLGGSLLAAPSLPALLATLARRGAPLVLVAGGGPLADTVRDLQPRLGLSDAVCHRMAILAMEQTALALADLSGLPTAADPAGIARLHASGHAALWLPAAMTLEASDLPESWDITSDSIAAWLAARLKAGRLTLVKSAPAAARTGPADWATAGLVDPLFPRYATAFGGPVELLTLEAAGAALTDGSLAA
ncbi:aspartate kinase [Ancylobacter sp. SL191]|uniref:amino acid kinase family protein n=1 Tax=Ancylobacter sp. SL191 TaxID=2995166 RepID=UPI002271E4CC|nr:aspartate kinase [Ancylobacter sp. SL191]WAC27220.1 aspartate kinase [Ancylobacter sp. SL191]